MKATSTVSTDSGENTTEAMLSRLIISQQEQTKEFAKMFSSMAKNGTETSHIETLIKRQALMQLPKFGGNPIDWPNFKKTFDDTTKEGKFSEIENLNRLKQALHGPALKNVQQLMMESKNVPTIIDRLSNDFGRPDLVYLELLSNLRKIRRDHKNVVEEMTNAMENLVHNIKVMNRPAYLNDHRLVMELTTKLPHHIQVRRAKHLAELSSSIDVQTLDEFCEWLKPYSKTVQMLSTITAHTHKENIHFHDQSQKTKNMQGPYKKETNSYKRSNEAIKCLICNKPHPTIKCYALIKQVPSERLKIAQNKRLCQGCLKSNNHSINDCRSAQVCGINGCKNRHHKMLHDKKATPIIEKVGINNHHEHTASSIHYQVLPVTLINGDKRIATYAFLDPGSSLTLLEAKVARKLELIGKEVPLQLVWTQGKNSNHVKSQSVELKIKGATKKGFLLKDVRTINDLRLPIQSLNYAELSDKYPYLKDLPIHAYENVRPTIIIGIKHNYLLMGITHRYGKIGEPIAMRTRLGWLIYGKAADDHENHHSMIIVAERAMAPNIRVHVCNRKRPVGSDNACACTLVIGIRDDSCGSHDTASSLDLRNLCRQFGQHKISI